MKQDVTVLVVDDEAMMRTLLDKILSAQGYTVVTAEDGQSAIEVLQSRQVTIMVSDIRMPRMDGFELLQHVRTHYPDIATILMTAYGDTFTVKDSLLLGADEYITKPFKSYEIAVVVERAYWRVNSARQEG